MVVPDCAPAMLEGWHWLTKTIRVNPRLLGPALPAFPVTLALDQLLLGFGYWRIWPRSRLQERGLWRLGLFFWRRRRCVAHLLRLWVLLQR